MIILNSSTNPYVINIVGPGLYPETVSLDDTRIVNIGFWGYNAEDVATGAQVNGFTCTSNSGIYQAGFANLQIWNNQTSAIDFEDSTGGSTFFVGGLAFSGCYFNGPEAVIATIFKNTNGGSFYDCHYPTPGGIKIDNTNGSNFAFNHGTISQGANSNGNIWLTNGGNFQALASKLNTDIQVDSGCSFNMRHCNVGTTGHNLTVSGSAGLYDCYTLSNVIVNNGGTVYETGFRSGTLTINAGGAYNIPAITVASEVLFPNGQVILTGTGAPTVSAPVGSLYLRTDGSSSTTLYVKESGLGSSGWVAK